MTVLVDEAVKGPELITVGEQKKEAYTQWVNGSRNASPTLPPFFYPLAESWKMKRCF